jgi:hypothetical protein
MTIKLAQLSDNIRISVLDGGMKIYYLADTASIKPVALVSKGKVIAGSTLRMVARRDGDWYRIGTLWADSPVASVTILYAMLAHFKRIVPSSDISPAAQAVVKRFYSKYKGTEVVVEGVDETQEEELGAGYVWSPKLLKVPVKVSKPKNDEELANLKNSVLEEFDKAYSNPNRTKRDDPDVFLATRSIIELHNLLQYWISEGGSKESQALQWINSHIKELEDFNSIYAKNILKYYNDQIDY